MSRIKDIARLVGLSPATVSMVLNGRPGFSEETRSRVVDAAKELNYQPSGTRKPRLELGESLPFVVCKRQGEIGAETSFFASLIESVECEAKENGFNLSVHYLRSCDSDLRDLAARSERGFLLLATDLEKSDVAALDGINRPFVLIDNAMIGVRANKVLINNRQGAYDAVAELYACGHRRIGYIHGEVNIPNFEERELGYKMAMRDLGLEVSPQWIATVNGSHEEVCQGMIDYCHATDDMPTAFFADNDIIAMGAMRGLRESGYSVPEQVSIIGFDDMPYCTMVTPNLSTMRVDMRSIGCIAVRLLLSNNSFCQTIEVETELVRRESVKDINILV